MRITVLSILIVIAVSAEDFLNNCTETSEHSSKVLSRRKRFLAFPDGSSFQFVFCTQNHGYLQLGDIVWFGNTAALAWELPSDPNIFYKFKDYKKIHEGNRRQDVSKHIFFLDENGKVIGKVPYRRRPIVNPAFAKRSVDSRGMKISINEMHRMQASKNVLKNLDANSIDFHRYGRVDLYERLEPYFDALGWNGQQCILRLLCETGKIRDTNVRQGNFLEEIMKATFTLPKGREAEQHEYDRAHGSDGECSNLYPKCEDIHGSQLYEQ